MTQINLVDTKITGFMNFFLFIFASFFYFTETFYEFSKL